MHLLFQLFLKYILAFCASFTSIHGFGGTFWRILHSSPFRYKATETILTGIAVSLVLNKYSWKVSLLRVSTKKTWICIQHSCRMSEHLSNGFRTKYYFGVLAAETNMICVRDYTHYHAWCNEYLQLRFLHMRKYLEWILTVHTQS